MGKEEKELEHYKKIFGVGDIATRGYKTAVKILEQQIEFLDGFKIKDKITQAAKDDPLYARAKDMWEGLPKGILELHKLKNELNIEYVEKEDEIIPISAKSIANGQLS